MESQEVHKRSSFMINAPPTVGLSSPKRQETAQVKWSQVMKMQTLLSRGDMAFPCDQWPHIAHVQKLLCRDAMLHEAEKSLRSNPFTRLHAAALPKLMITTMDHFR